MSDPIKQIETDVKDLSGRIKRIEQILSEFDFSGFKAEWQRLSQEMGSQKGHPMYQQIDDIQTKVAMITTHLDALVRNISSSAASMNSTTNEFFQLKTSVQSLVTKISTLESHITQQNNLRNSNPAAQSTQDLDGYRT